QIERWFGASAPGQRPTFAERLRQPTSHGSLSESDLAQVKYLFEQQLLHQTVPWQTTIAYLVARR
ncbi:MAG TPA: hypothetical protein PKE64_07055, partial [Anaerolineae bacterium]|nr:hypothetical protein [Anaerolineae bacterium]